MDIEFICQKCNQKMVIDSSAAGKTIKCSNCQDPVIVPEVKPIEVKSVEIFDSKMKECPFCGEQVFSIAKKCKHCGETIDVVLRTAEEAMRASNRQNQNINVNQNVAPTVVVTQKENYPWAGHLFMTVITGGFWAIIWGICYWGRDRNRYW
jgi:predicted RNA-binding Zn-ribbon protein involved in translation (DUF1610 family)